jgi:hypothetical protein
MILSGGGKEMTLESVGKNINVTTDANFERKDLSGQSSGSATAAAGNKPKNVGVGMVIPFSGKSNLTKLLEMAEAMDDKGEPVVYTVADRLCNAAMIRQVIFIGKISYQKASGLLAWDVSFSLREYKSVGEKREERQRDKVAATAAKTDGVTSVSSTDPAKVNDAIEKANAS